MDVKKISDFTVTGEGTITKRVIFDNDKVLCFVLNIKTGGKVPPHSHEYTSLVLNVLSGKAKIKAGADETEMTGGMIALIKGEDLFEIPEVTEDVALLISISPNPANVQYKQDIG